MLDLFSRSFNLKRDRDRRIDDFHTKMLTDDHYANEPH